MRKRLTLPKLQELQKQGKIRGYTDITPAKKKSRTPGAASKPKGLLHIEAVLAACSIPFAQEQRFTDKRKFRFDIAIPDMMLAIEYEGLMSKKSRHTTITGYTRDAEKYNLAQASGWTVLRYTAINYKDFERDLLLIREKLNRNPEP